MSRRQPESKKAKGNNKRTHRRTRERPLCAPLVLIVWYLLSLRSTLTSYLFALCTSPFALRPLPLDLNVHQIFGSQLPHEINHPIVFEFSIAGFDNQKESIAGS